MKPGFVEAKDKVAHYNSTALSSKTLCCCTIMEW